MIEFKQGDKYNIKFGSKVVEATVVKVTTLKVTVAIDLGGFHPLPTTYSKSDFTKKIEEAK